MKDYIIRETEDFLSLSTLFHESGMGVTIEERMPDRIIKMWRMDDALTGELIAAVTFEIRDGAYSLGDIAVCNPRATVKLCSLLFLRRQKSSE